MAPHVGAQSNLNGAGPAPVGSHPALSVAGAVDMGGNVAEWVWNAWGDKRFLLGGAWEDPEYAFTQAAAASPWQRRATQGFRLAVYPEPPAAAQLAAVELPEIDFFAIAAGSDAEAAFTRKLARYDPTPLRAKDEGTLDLPGGGQAQRVTIESAYGGERLPLYVILPEGVPPPYQAVVWMGGLNILIGRDTDNGIRFMTPFLEFLHKSGRMVVMPVYSGSLGRNDGRSLQRLYSGPVSRREMFTAWTRDLGRTLDYLQTRSDVAMEHVAFIGLSLGALAGQVMVRFEDRIETMILWSGGFAAATDPETAPALVRGVEDMTLPVLMLNGRHDFVFPYATHQVPFFERLGTPPDQKRHVVWDAGHFGFPIGEFLRENLDWLDRQFGPVARAD